jgi:hypothetical protein
MSVNFAIQVAHHACIRQINTVTHSELPLDQYLTLSYLPGMGKRIDKFVQRYWSYIALALSIIGWVTHAVGYAGIAIASLLALIYFLFEAPATCGAEIRSGLHCRNNSKGLLLGCHFNQHKWQRVRDVFVSRKWRDVFHDLTASPKDKLGTISALISVLSLFIGLPLWFLK